MTRARRRCADCGSQRGFEQFSTVTARVCNPCKKRKQREASRARHLRQTYKITLDEYKKIVETQGGVCAICKGSRRYNLAVDHDHAIEKLFGVRSSIRGALCKRCNKFLRDVGDDPELLRNAIDYLRNPPAKRVLFP